jgi:carboxyl-terminal processing protease
MKKLFFLFLLFSFSVVHAQQYSADTLRPKCITLRRFLEQQHYKPLQWNDTASALLYDRWLELLDRKKELFTKEDIAQLAPYKTKLGEELKGNGWAFFDKSITIYKTRIKQIDSVLITLLTTPLNFSKPDSIAWPFVSYAASKTQQEQEWQKYIKWQVLRDIAENVLDTGIETTNYTKLPANFEALSVQSQEKIKKRLLLSFKEKESINNDFNKELGDLYLGAISWCYDPHTEYMNTSDKDHFENAVNSMEFSAGFQMDKNDKGDWEISYLIPGGAAWSNGELHKGDIVVKIKLGNDAEKELASLDDDAEVQELLNGNVSENIIVSIRTAGGVQKSVQLKMQKITDEGGIVKSYILNGPKKIGYITLPGFYTKEGEEDNANGCSNDVAKEVLKLKKDSIAGLILDLRYNGGGSMWEALQLAGIFINEGPLSSVKDKTGKVHFLRDPNRGTIYDGPMLVLVNGSSASASELVSAALQDYHRALIVGGTTYGKGSAQIVMPMDTTANFSTNRTADDYVKVTMEKFYRVDGSTTQWKGVVPDIFLPQLEDGDKTNEKSNASALLPDFSKPAIYDALPALPIATLKANSADRVNVNNNFKAIKDFSAWYAKDELGFFVPLQWSTYAVFHKKALNKYKEIENISDSSQSVLTAANSSFDKQQLVVKNEENRKLNAAHLSKIEKDNYIAEAYLIMTDWLNNKNSNP